MAMSKSMGKMLGLGLILPSSPNSPKANHSLKANSCFCKAIKRAIGKSKWLPDLGKSEGERLMVIFKGGKVKSLFCKADWTRCLASWIELLARPEITNAGKALVKVASTATISATPLCMVAQNIVLIMIRTCFWDFYLILLILFQISYASKWIIYPRITRH